MCIYWGVILLTKNGKEAGFPDSKIRETKFLFGFWQCSAHEQSLSGINATLFQDGIISAHLVIVYLTIFLIFLYLAFMFNDVESSRRIQSPKDNECSASPKFSIQLSIVFIGVLASNPKMIATNLLRYV